MSRRILLAVALPWALTLAGCSLMLDFDSLGGGDAVGLDGSTDSADAGTSVPSDAQVADVGGTDAADAAEPDAGTVVDAQVPDAGEVEPPDASVQAGDAGGDAPDSGVADSGILTYSIGGTVSGLLGTPALELDNNGGDTLPITGNGPFAFATRLPAGATYDVTVHSQQPAQTCSVSSGTGTVASSDVTDVAVSCSITGGVQVGGKVHGLAGPLTLLETETGQTRVVTLGNTSYSFTVYPNASYQVVVSQAPARQSCGVVNAAGPTGTSAIAGVDVYCVSVPKALASPIGDRWNDYVRGSDLRTACDGSEQGYWGVACVHAAERLYVDYPGGWPCSQLSASDELGAFDWSCSPAMSASGQPVARFRSGPLKVPLSSLLDFAAARFKDNRVVISGGPLTLATPALPWWSNPVAALTGRYLMSEGTIYLITNGTGGPYSFSASRVGYVQPPSLVSLGPSNCTYLVDGGNTRFTWIEGRFDVSACESGVQAIRFNGGDFAVLDHVAVSGLWSPPQSGVNLIGAFKGGLLRQVSVTAPNALSAAAIHIDAPTGGWTTLRDVTTAGTAPGVSLKTPHAKIERLTSTMVGRPGSGNAWAALLLGQGAYDALIADVHATGMGAVIQTATHAGNVFARVSAFGLQDPFSGVEMRVPAASESKATNTLMGVTVANSDMSLGPAIKWTRDRVDNLVATLLSRDRSGLATYPWNGGPTRGPNLFGFASAWHAVEGIRLGDATILTSGTVLINRNGGGSTSPSSQCVVAGVNSCQGINLSTGNDVGGGDYFVAPSSATLRLLDGGVPNAMLGVNQVSSASTFVHVWHSPAAPARQADCDAQFPGSLFVTDRCETTSLLYAIEGVGDGIGNDNLLCESGETCVFMPNLGAYQGEGTLVPAGVVAGGPFTVGITLLKHQTNGAVAE